MDGLAMDGLVFRNAYSSAPWTLPAVSSIMTGLTPSAHDTGMKQNVLPDGVPTLAEHFLKAGYVTAAVGVSEWLKSYSKLSRGFVEYNFLPPSLGLGIGDIFYRLFTTKTYDESPRGDNLTNTAVDWIRAQKDDDFFFWLHYVDPHAPYSPPEEFLRDGKPPSSMDSIIYVPPLELATGEVFLTRDQVEWLRRLYIGEVRYVDAQVGRFIDTLKQEKLYDQALIILTSDHGEEFLEHGSLDHGQNLYDELLKVPLIIKLPHSTVTASIDHPVSTMGLMRTILELCELESGANVDHLQSLVWSWNSKSESFAGEPIIAEGVIRAEPGQAVIFDRWKYVRYSLSGREALYDRAEDPAEQFNIAHSHHESIQKARKLLARHNQRSEKIRDLYGIQETGRSQYDAEMLRRLKSLGYIQ
jgi:arylsulfatase A-like enzyme